MNWKLKNKFKRDNYHSENSVRSYVWFAWFPIRLDGGHWVLFENVRITEEYKQSYNEHNTLMGGWKTISVVQ